jgi:hypothetical protein
VFIFVQRCFLLTVQPLKTFHGIDAGIADNCGIMPLTNNNVKNGAFVKVGTPRCGVTARVQRAELTTPPVKITPYVAPLNAARTARRAVPTLHCLRTT